MTKIVFLYGGSRLPRYFFVLALLLGTCNAWGAYEILLSPTAGKTSSSTLDGQTVSGAIFVYTSPDAGVKGVRFYVDDPGMQRDLVTVDWVAPFDLMGGTSTLPYDTAQLTPGSHTLTARISKKSGYGSSVEVVQASFMVAAASSTPAPTPTPSSLPNVPNAYEILLSPTAGKTSSSTLDGQTVSGAIFVYTSPDAGVKGVRFYVDDPGMQRDPVTVDWVAPFDLMGGTSTLPYDTAQLTPGSHTLTARISKKSGYGASVEVVQASFMVNGASSTELMSDDFNDGDAADWTVVTDPGVTGIANWRVTNGQYEQVNDMGFVSDGAHHLGTYSYLNGSMGLSNYRLTLKALPKSLLGRDIGIVFGYQNPDTYYRLYLSASDGGARVEKRVNGVSTLLAQNARGFKADVPLNITIDWKGPLIQIGLNEDAQLFGIYDNDIPSGGIALYCRHACVFDDVRLLNNATDTSLVIARPEAYSVLPAASIDVSAVVMNPPPGEVKVAFTLGGVPCGEPVSGSSAEPGKFSALCQATRYFNDLTATLYLNGQPTFFSDTNLNIGAQGNNYIALGDSITFGLNDTFLEDNDSEPDKRVVSSTGYEALLAGALNRANPFPNIIFNYGYPGEKTSSVLGTGRLDAALSRNSNANYVLLLLGTNDAGSGALKSGKGCTTNCAGTFKGNMQEILGKITAAGKTPIVARVPPRFGEDGAAFLDPESSGRNVLAKAYNKVITTELGLASYQIGPDFYRAFLAPGVNRFSLMSDFVHPNALGYRLMAQMWTNHLTGSTGLPFMLENICVVKTAGGVCQNPLTYRQNLIGSGGQYYVDAPYVLTGDLPDEIKSGIWVMPQNGDKAVSVANYLTFNFSGTATVYVAYDEGEAARPGWLAGSSGTSGFTDTGLVLKTTNTAAPTMRLYKKSYTGTAVLGGNRAGVGGAMPENYVVIVKPEPN